MNESVCRGRPSIAESTGTKVESVLVCTDEDVLLSDDIEVPSSADPLWCWDNVTLSGTEIPRRCLLERPEGPVLYAVLLNHDDEDRHNRVHKEMPTAVPLRPIKEKQETESHEVQIGSSGAGYINFNVTDQSPSLS